MDKDSAKDFLPLVQALAEGKTIQYMPQGEEIGTRQFPKDVWTDVTDTTFQSPRRCYRIKPEPVEIVAWYHPQAKAICDQTSPRTEAEWISSGWSKRKVLVLPEE